MRGGHLLKILVGVTLGLTAAGCTSPLDSQHANDSSSSVCANDLMQQFDLSYRPVLSDPSKCAQCHSDGGSSPYKFASSDLSAAFSTFMQLGADMIDSKAQDPTHAPGVTGPGMTVAITSARQLWDPAYSSFVTCNGSSAGAQAVLLADQNDPNLYFGDGRTETLTWNTASSALTPGSLRFPGQFSINVSVNYEVVNGVNVAIGYTFSNAKLQILTGTQQAVLAGVVIYINGVQATGIENLLSASATAKGIDPVTVYAGAVQVPLSAVSNADKISIGFSSFQLQSRTDNPPTPANPVLKFNTAATNQTKVGITVSNDSTARRWCLTASPVKPSSTAVACPGFENNLLTNGWLSSRPTQFDLTTLGAPVTSGQVITAYVWVANSDLILSAGPGSAQVTFDNTAPSKETLSSISVTTTQIADLIGLSDSNETVTWCVKVAATMMGVQTSQGCSFNPNKPSYVGLPGGGTNYVAIFTRDIAGNTSTSAVATANNPFGQITYAQLTDSGAGPRAVMMNNCASCHGTGGAQQSFWDMTSYSDTVAKKSLILNRIENSTTPMPASGLMDVKSRALIELWFSQTSIPVQL